VSDIESQLAQAHEALILAEADAAVLRSALEQQLDPTRTIRDRHMQAYELIEVDHPGAALLAEIQQLMRQRDTAQALEAYWQERHGDAWTLIGRLDFALEQIGAAKGIIFARELARRMRSEIQQHIGKETP